MVKPRLDLFAVTATTGTLHRHMWSRPYHIWIYHAIPCWRYHPSDSSHHARLVIGAIRLDRGLKKLVSFGFREGDPESDGGESEEMNRKVLRCADAA